MLDTKFGFPPAAASPAPNPKRRRRRGGDGEAEADMREEAVERLRGVVRDSVGKHLYTSAIFLADKVAAATGDPADVYMLAQALFLGRHYRRALHVLNNDRLLRDLRFRFLAAKCLVSSTPPPPSLFHFGISSNGLRACVPIIKIQFPFPSHSACGLTFRQDFWPNISWAFASIRWNSYVLLSAGGA
jgi:hypothetical protein